MVTCAHDRPRRVALRRRRATARPHRRLSPELRGPHRPRLCRQRRGPDPCLREQLPAHRHAARRVSERVPGRGREHDRVRHARRALRRRHRRLHRRAVRGRPSRPAAGARTGSGGRRRLRAAMSEADLAGVEEANASFYRAFETLDLAQMDAVWLHPERARCIHRGWPMIAGWRAIRESWEAIFASTTEMRFTIADARAGGGPDLAWVTCTENILSDVQGRVSVTSLLATNLFERTPDGWLMVHHHASHILSSEGG